jgi:hypothetical protein
MQTGDNRYFALDVYRLHPPLNLAPQRVSRPECEFAGSSAKRYAASSTLLLWYQPVDNPNVSLMETAYSRPM